MTRLHRHHQRWLAGASALLATGAMVSAFSGPASAEPAEPAAGGTPYGGFTTAATSTPLRLEIFEPAIPLPASPQAELNFSYTNVTGSSGPDSTAIASAMWPGGAVGTGLPAILQTSGLPPNLLGNGYPVQVSSQYPGQPNSGSQEFLPGMVGRVSSSNTQSVARAGYSTSGQVGGDPASGTSASQALDQLKSGNLGFLGSLLTGPNSNSNTGSNPLGVLSAVISVGGMSGSSVTDYSDAATVTATATSQVGAVQLLGGLVKMDGVTVSSSSSSSLDAKGKATQNVVYGGINIQGQAFQLTSNGIVAAGSTTGLPDASATASLAKLGITITMPKPTQTADGTSMTTSAAGPTITIDTQPVISMLQLDKLPLSSGLNQLPSSANQIKGPLLAALSAHPKIVVELGEVSTSAQTIAPFSAGGSGTGSDTGAGVSGDLGTGGMAGTPGTTGDIGGAPDSGAPTDATTGPLKNASALPGLPPLGSIPSLLVIAGFVLAGGLAWFFRAAGIRALGAGTTCSHGLVNGLPNLRKA